MQRILNGWLSSAIALCLLFGSAATATAQIDRASLTGVITDSSAAVIPGVSVMVRHVSTNATTTLVTDREGGYAAQGLMPSTVSATRWSCVRATGSSTTCSIASDPKTSSR